MIFPFSFNCTQLKQLAKTYPNFIKSLYIFFTFFLLLSYKSLWKLILASSPSLKMYQESVLFFIQLHILNHTAHIFVCVSRSRSAWFFICVSSDIYIRLFSSNFQGLIPLFHLSNLLDQLNSWSNNPFRRNEKY